AGTPVTGTPAAGTPAAGSPTAVPGVSGVAPLAPPAPVTPDAARPLLPPSTGGLGTPMLIVNQHGGLFYEADADLAENAAYAAWLGAGAIRVFGTDSNTLKPWDGRRVGRRIAQWAPSLRTHRVKLIVALVNNHRPVPGESVEAAGWMDGHFQLLLPFYWSTWRYSYLRFMGEVITTVRDAGALDVVAAWELGNELHTPQAPTVFVDFLREAVTELRRVDPITPIWPGTMGANHLQPWNTRSPVARWLYCEAPVDAYTLHAYDWLSGEFPGDMPIHWDLDNIVSEPCPSGRRLPVVVEELGTSRSLPGFYTAEDEEARLQLEQHQLRFVLAHPLVRAVGVWNGISPRVADMTFGDNRRGLTSYGPGAAGTGSCYGVEGTVATSVVEIVAPRCRLELVLRALHTFRPVGTAGVPDALPGA
ncbi:MAG: hypothetical protein M3442_00080, partial [Chloroflexota bacterium]|nr:hypothetical protein [Chloroflexota bacterium]